MLSYTDDEQQKGVNVCIQITSIISRADSERVDIDSDTDRVSVGETWHHYEWEPPPQNAASV